MTNLTSAIMAGALTGIFLAVIGVQFALIRVAVALEKMRIQVLLRSDP